LGNHNSNKAEFRREIAWFYTAKYPEQAIKLLQESMDHQDLELARLLIGSSIQTHPTQIWSWIKDHDYELDRLFANANDKYEFKLTVLKGLAQIPEQKWAAYQEAQQLVASSHRPNDHNNLAYLAKTLAAADPEEAINRALANGAHDLILFNGGIAGLMANNAARASDLILQNQDLADAGTISEVAYKLLAERQYRDAYTLVNSLTDAELRKTSQEMLARPMAKESQTQATEFLNSLVTEEAKIKVARHIAISMSVDGRPVKDQLELFDSGLKSIAPEKKAFNYAYALKDWIKEDPEAINRYLNEVRIQDQPLADAIKKSIEYLKKD
jgi:hypothetical protein